MNEPLNIPVQVPQGDATLALLERIAAAIEEAGEKSVEASEKTTRSFDGLRRAADGFNEVRQAISSLLGDVMQLAEGLAEGADEAAALAGRSRELGLDFDEAAESAGRFLDETSAMGAANQLAARGVNLTQQELNALTRVAGATSQALRITTEEGVSRLTDALISGRSRALAPFGAELTAASGSTHTMRERLAALVSEADKVTPAVDNATDSINRLNDSFDDLKRDFSSGFVEGIREMERLRVSTHGANEETADLSLQMRALGSTASEVVSLVANAVGVVVAAVGMTIGGAMSAIMALGAAQQAVLDGNIRGAGSAALAAFDRNMTQGLANDSFRFFQDRVASLRAITAAGSTQRTSAAPEADAPATPPTTPPGGGGGGRSRDERPGGIAIGGMAGAVLDRMAAEARQRQEREEAASIAQRLEAVQRAEERASMDRLIAQEAARERHQRGSTLADRLDQQREQRALTRAQRNINDRLAMEVSFTDRMEDLHSQRVNAAEQEAEFVTSAFNSLGQAMGKHIQLVVTGEETIGTALQGMLADTLSSIGQEAIVKGAMQIAEGLAALAGIVTAPLAPGHFAAGAAFIGVGALASAAGAALAPAPSVPSGGGGGGGGSAGRAASVSKGGGAEGDGSTVVNVMFGGPQYGTGGTRQAAREIAGVLNRGAVQGGVRLNLRAAGGAF